MRMSIVETFVPFLGRPDIRWGGGGRGAGGEEARERGVNCCWGSWRKKPGGYMRALYSTAWISAPILIWGERTRADTEDRTRVSEDRRGTTHAAEGEKGGVSGAREKGEKRTRNSTACACPHLRSETDTQKEARARHRRFDTASGERQGASRGRKCGGSIYVVANSSRAQAAASFITPRAWRPCAAGCTFPCSRRRSWRRRRSAA